MPRALTIPPLDAAASADLRWRYDATDDPEDRLRYQMVWLAQGGKHAPEIARLVLRSEDTVRRVLHRHLAGGLDAVPRRAPPGATSTITPTWEAELLRVMELDPHIVGVQSANWTTGRLAAYLAERTGIAVSDETVRPSLRAAGYVCKRPTWTLQRRAAEQDGYVGNARGWRRCWPGRSPPRRHPWRT